VATDDPLTDAGTPARRRACAPSAMSGQLPVSDGGWRHAVTQDIVAQAKRWTRAPRCCRTTTGVQLRGPERSEGHVSFNCLVRRHLSCEPPFQA
jgi:hypothetical protein